MANLIGKILKNRYRVDEFLGRGGMAEVYKVHDLSRGTALAMKVLSEDLAEDRIFLKRFQREAQNLARLQHPNIVRFYGLEQDGRTVFMVMDFIEGTTLRSQIALQKKPFSPTQIWNIMQPVCSALHYAHAMGIVHCDVKPANIMVDSGGHVFLSDFGIARQTDSATSTMVGVGTPAYMAPELVRGNDPSPAADIYSLSIILYEMLTGGQRPFTGERAGTTGTISQKVRWEQIKLDPPSPLLYNPKISSAMEMAVMKGLAKDPRKRFANALQMLESLRQALPQNIEYKQADLATGAAASWLKDLAGRFAALYRSKPAYVLSGIAAVIIILFMIFQTRDKNVTYKGKSELDGTATSQAFETQAPLPDAAVASAEPSATMTSRPSHIPPECSDKGIMWTSVKDNMPMVCVPEGKFEMGGYKPEESPASTIRLDAFWIDQFEVSNAQFAAFVEDTGYITTAENEGGRVLDFAKKDWFIQPGADWRHPSGAGSTIDGLDNYPVLQISWHDASAYCEWAGKQLPSEAQWEKAARGTNGKTFKWENNKNYYMCVGANFADSELSMLPWAKDGCTDNFKYTCPVDEVFKDAVSPYEAYNLIGNAQEWMLDDFDKHFYERMPTNNPVNMNGGNLKSLRGGSWASAVEKLRYAARTFDAAEKAYDTTGFRCVYIP